MAKVKAKSDTETNRQPDAKKGDEAKKGDANKNVDVKDNKKPAQKESNRNQRQKDLDGVATNIKPKKTNTNINETKGQSSGSASDPNGSTKGSATKKGTSVSTGSSTTTTTGSSAATTTGSSAATTTGSSAATTTGSSAATTTGSSVVTTTGSSAATTTDSSAATTTGSSTATTTGSSAATTTGSSAATTTGSSAATTTGSSATTPTDGSAATLTGSSAATPTDGSVATLTGSSATTPTDGSAAILTGSSAATPTDMSAAGLEFVGLQPSALNVTPSLHGGTPSPQPMIGDFTVLNQDGSNASAATSQAAGAAPQGPKLFDVGEGEAIVVRPTDVGSKDGEQSYLVATMQAMALKDPDLIVENITDNRDGTFAVSMFDSNLKPVEVSVNQEDLLNTTVQMSNPRENWGQVLEAAFDKQYGEILEREGGNPGLALSAFTGVNTPVFNVNERYADDLIDALRLNKLVVIEAFQDVDSVLKKGDLEITVQPRHSYAITGYDFAEDAFRVKDANGNDTMLSKDDILSGDFYATMAGGFLRTTEFERGKSRYTKDELLGSFPTLNKNILDWSFAQALGEPGKVADVVDESRVNETLALSDIYVESGVPLFNTTNLYEGRSGGLINGLRDRKFSYPEIVDFVQGFRTEENRNFDTGLIQQFVNNAKRLKNSDFTTLWRDGVSPRIIADLADAGNGGHLGALFRSNLSLANVKKAIDRVTMRKDDFEYLAYNGKDDLQTFVDVAGRNPRDWATNLLATNVPRLDSITQILNFRVLDHIINDRNVGAGRIGPVVEWAYGKANGDLDETRQALDAFNAWATPRKKEDIWALIEAGNFDEIG